MSIRNENRDYNQRINCHRRNYDNSATSHCDITCFHFNQDCCWSSPDGDFCSDYFPTRRHNHKDYHEHLACLGSDHDKDNHQFSSNDADRRNDRYERRYRDRDRSLQLAHHHRNVHGNMDIDQVGYYYRWMGLRTLVLSFE